MANDEAFFEIAQGLAARVTRELPEGDPAARIRRAFLLALCREPSETELAALQSYYDRQAAALANEPERAKALLAPAIQANNSPAGAAALVLAARAILNTDAFITRE